MKWVTDDAGAGSRTAVLDGTAVYGLRAGVHLLHLLQRDALTEAGESARRNPDEVRPLDEVRLLAPLPRPPSLRDGLCFLDHLRGCYRALGRSDELPPSGRNDQRSTSRTPVPCSARTTTSRSPLAAPCSTWSWRSAR